MTDKRYDEMTTLAGEELSLPTLLRISNKLRSFVDFVGRWGSWLIVPLIVITCFDVIARKLVWIQIWLVSNFGRIFESTLLQELEWHFHTGLFAFVLGYGYIWNTHVRVDLVRENIAFRKQAWIEFLGCTIFLIPFTAVVVWFSFEYAHASWSVNEISASQVGLTHRFLIKGVLMLGLIVSCIAGIAVWLQTIIVLFGRRDVRFGLMTLEWPEESGTMIEGKKRLDLEDLPDEPVKPGTVPTGPGRPQTAQ